MKESDNIVEEDLQYICNGLKKELVRLSGKNLLITGGAGFLGYYLIQSVLYWNKTTDESKGVHLTILDNFVRGIPKWMSEFEKNSNLRFIRCDITNPLPEDLGEFQYIIHAASIASPTYYRKYPIETMDANVNGLRSLLEYCRKQKEKKLPIEGFLFYSSSEIYGDPTPENIPTPESYNGNVSCTGPRACYDESKRYGETLCVNFVQQYDLPIKIVRPFNNYGPGLKITDRRVIADLFRDVLKGRDITLFSDGSPTRTFCYVADAIIGYYKILIGGRRGEAYNIGVEEPEISVRELSERIVSLARRQLVYSGKVEYKVSIDKDYLVNNPNRRCPVITKARSELGYHPGVPLDKGLKRSLIWYTDHWDAEEA